MPDFYVTFGQKYQQEPHPVASWAHPDGYCRITAPDYEKAQKTAFAALGEYWAFMYPEKHFDDRVKSIYPRGELQHIEYLGESELDIAKWNFKTHEYEPYTPNPQWKIKLYSNDMNEAINCTSCGKDMLYGDTFTSRQLHNHIGLGYPVCRDCYDHEWKLERELS